ncbi:hypothetical protein AA0113_g5780 [Alternaria arborescens]|uniref:DUF7708 domain-containing protein n=1 Tax=Alternaria arborescens TaxID=156630 RepID=A0A4Q4S4P4_9PLEO|nr:hypothetical protein AA0113_g5780 [Alternaria arborescens]
MSELLETFSGTGDVAKAIDPRVGGGLIGALSMLFQVGKNKIGREETITKGIERLTLGLKNMEILSDTLEHSDMMRPVQKVYEEVERFCKKSTAYYNMPPWKRVWEAVANPYKLNIAIELGDIKDSILDAIQTYHILQEREQKEKNKKDSEKAYNDHINRLKKVVMAENYSTEAHADQMKEHCVKLYEHVFSNMQSHYSLVKLQEMNPELLRQVAHLEDWAKCRNPSLLLLLGKNFEVHDYNRGLLWLSPATLQVSEMCKASHVSAFYSPSCQQQGLFRQPEVSFDRLLSSLILQVLNSSRTFFEDHHEEVYQELQPNQNTPCDRKSILIKLLQALDTSTTAILIIDRLDMVGASKKDVSANLDKLVTIMLDPKVKCRIKAVVTGLQDRFHGITSIEEVVKERNWSKITRGKTVSVYGMLQWNQENLDDD